MKLNKILKEEKELSGKINRINPLISDLDETFLEDVNLTEDADLKKEDDIYVGDIENVLNTLLKRNKSNAKYGLNEYLNVLFIGPAGCGKTARIEAWARNNSINLVEVRAADMDETDLGGAISPEKEKGVVQRYSSIELDSLDEPNSVLFLDELNRAPNSVTGSMLTLINNHTITDTRVKNRQRKFNGFLFTIAAINPSEGTDYDVETLDQAMLDRFIIRYITNDSQSALQHFVKTFEKLANLAKSEGDTEEEAANLGRRDIAKALLSHPDFSFDSSSADNSSDPRKTFSTRSLMGLLLYCDGTKKDFLDKWDERCKQSKKEMAVSILNKYQDKYDKANDALLNHETESDLFNKKTSIHDSLLNSLKNSMKN